ncbi:MAG: NUDIX hydrolase [Candidatus Omnitrophica bacterium]|nr:NUDIX hydrolase [Candidatus Omnitrophota bacterium]
MSEDVRILKKGQYIHFLQKGPWEYIKRCNCTGIVIIVAMTDEKKVIFVEQFRPPVGQNVIEFPAGLVNDQVEYENETFLDAAKRELYEETGFEAQGIEKIMHGPVSGGSSADLVTIVRALGLKKIHPGGGNEDEDITIHEVDLDKVDHWLKTQEERGCLIEPKVYTGLYFLRFGR